MGNLPKNIGGIRLARFETSAVIALWVIVTSRLCTTDIPGTQKVECPHVIVRGGSNLWGCVLPPSTLETTETITAVPVFPLGEN